VAWGGVNELPTNVAASGCIGWIGTATPVMGPRSSCSIITLIAVLRGARVSEWQLALVWTKDALGWGPATLQPAALHCR